MKPGDLATWLGERRWWVALIVVVMGGYIFGKDMALRDNGRDVAASASGATE